MLKIMSISSETDGGIIKNIVCLLHINFTNYFTGEETDYKTRSIHMYIFQRVRLNIMSNLRNGWRNYQKIFCHLHTNFTYLFHIFISPYHSYLQSDVSITRKELWVTYARPKFIEVFKILKACKRES